jgi:uncharacterized Zn finger protein
MTDAETACPACGSTEFQLYRESGYDGAGFAIHCADCENATAQVVARTLDARLQDTENEQLTEWSG